jgi:hypothetical protein
MERNWRRGAMVSIMESASQNSQFHDVRDCAHVRTLRKRVARRSKIHLFRLEQSTNGTKTRSWELQTRSDTKRIPRSAVAEDT